MNVLIKEEKFIISQLVNSIKEEYLNCQKLGDAKDPLIINFLRTQKEFQLGDFIKSNFLYLINYLFKIFRNSYLFNSIFSYIHNLFSNKIIWIPLRYPKNSNVVKTMDSYILKEYSEKKIN